MSEIPVNSLLIIEGTNYMWDNWLFLIDKVICHTDLMAKAKLFPCIFPYIRENLRRVRSRLYTPPISLVPVETFCRVIIKP